MRLIVGDMSSLVRILWLLFYGSVVSLFKIFMPVISLSLGLSYSDNFCHITSTLEFLRSLLLNITRS